MLVLSRKESEEIVCNNNIVIRIERIGANRVSISVQAPREIPIRRGEIQERWKREQSRYGGAA